MATPNANSSNLLNRENVGFEAIQSDDVKSEDLKAEDVKSEEDEGQDLHRSALAPQPSLPINVTSPHWREFLETLLRFPGMKPNMMLFRPGSPIAEIAFALGVTDAAYTIVENNWVTIAERVFEIQTCCLMHAQHIDFDIAADGWITWDITAEWYARVLRDLQGKGFGTTCTAMVPFVVRVYSQTKSWVRFRHRSGRQMHKKVMDTLKSDPSAHQIVTTCSMVARGFNSVVRAIRKRKLEQAKVI